ncbi:nicotinate phosphoribosyltransferase [Herbiconiux moechotypicola]|uniref:Nicotinate phosphoribosyltransferase n=1 Tax=Herbiconiux moechotypicola TaxID=637393 RepID=A0ABN3D7S7_9MICO
MLTDRYELTMVDAALRSGTAGRASVFEVFARSLPAGRRYGVVAGTGRLLELVSRFRFGDAELAWLAENAVVSSRTLDWLADYRFTGTIRGYHEGELYFPDSPILTVESGFAEGVLLETLVLSVLNYDSAVAGAASRMVSAARGRPLAEMGSRRTGERSAVAAARAAYIVGFGATSNLEAGRSWGVPTMGTAAHAFTMLHDSEEEAFRAQVEALGASTTLLVDTYDVARGVETAVRVAGPGLGAVRLDSGDLLTLVASVRRRLDELGNSGTRITVTNDLDEYAIAALAAAPVDSYGVGTSLVTGSGHPASGMVYKLVSREGPDGSMVPVAKRSASKATHGGRKHPVRLFGADGRAALEAVYVGGSDDASGAAAPAAGGRDLVVPLMVDGEAEQRMLGVAGVQAARRHHTQVLAELPDQAFRLAAGDPAVRTELRQL